MKNLPKCESTFSKQDNFIGRVFVAALDPTGFITVPVHVIA